MKEYAVYDMKEYEQCVRIGTLKEIAEFLNSSSESLRSYISRKRAGKINNLMYKRYEIMEVSGLEEVVEKSKTDKEIFQELINKFKEKTIKFEIFDEFKWKLKGIKDKVITDEEWKQIENFHYSISNYGRIRNEKSGKLKNPRYHRWILQVDIYENGKRYMCNITRAVANYFIRELKDSERVIHKDGDSRNNYYKNLEIVSK